VGGVVRGSLARLKIVDWQRKASMFAEVVSGKWEERREKFREGWLGSQEARETMLLIDSTTVGMCGS
jgi:hypothetical protein